MKYLILTICLFLSMSIYAQDSHNNFREVDDIDWVTGEVKADANVHYVGFIDSSTYKSDDHYIFTFNEGKLQNFVKL